VPPAQRGESETQPLNNIEKKKGVSVTVPILSHGICQKPKTHPPLSSNLFFVYLHGFL